MYRTSRFEKFNRPSNYQYLWCIITIRLYGRHHWNVVSNKHRRKLSKYAVNYLAWEPERLTKIWSITDIKTGSNDLCDAERLQFNLRLMPKSGGFELRKWCTNHPMLLENISLLNERKHKLELSDEQPEQILALVVTWLPHSDESTRIRMNVNRLQKGEWLQIQRIYSIKYRLCESRNSGG